MRLSTTVKRWISAVTLVGVAALPAAGADLAKELDELLLAVEARIESSSVKKEAKKLGKAVKKIERITAPDPGPNDLFKVLSATYGAKSQDQALLDEARDVLDCLRAQVEDEKLNSESFLEQLDDKFRGRLQKKIDGAQRRLDAATPLLDENGKKAAKLLRVAFVKFAKSSKFGQKSLDRQVAATACRNLGTKIHVKATLTGDDGSSTKFNGFGSAESFFSQTSIQGCETRGNSDLCTRVLGFTMNYEGQSRETGDVFGFFLRFDAEANTEGQLSYEGNAAAVEILLSSASKIGGCFEGTVQAFDPEAVPQTYTVKGTFVVRRR